MEVAGSRGSTVLLYWEEQVAGLCAVHAINALLQGPHTGPGELAQLAHQLDAQESHQLSTTNSVGNATNNSGSASFNVSADGNYSVQVIVAQLNAFDLDLVSLDHPRMAARRADPGNDELVPGETSEGTGRRGDEETTAETPRVACDAYVCWLMSHWFAVRRVRMADGSYFWFNLNSLNDAGPELLSPFYHQAFFDSLRHKGYTIFAVCGELPPVIADDPREDRRWRVVPTKPAGSGSVMSGAGSAQGGTNRDSIAEDDDDALQRVLEESMLSAAMAASQQEHDEQEQRQREEPQQQTSQMPQTVVTNDSDVSDDDDLAAALALSIQQSGGEIDAAYSHRNTEGGLSVEPLAEPDLSQPCTTIQIRLSTGEVLKRTFNISDKVGDVRRFIDEQSPSAGSYHLRTNYPMKVYSPDDENVSLESADLKNAVLIQQMT